jgi:hypothetical protein
LAAGEWHEAWSGGLGCSPRARFIDEWFDLSYDPVTAGIRVRYHSSYAVLRLLPSGNGDGTYVTEDRNWMLTVVPVNDHHAVLKLIDSEPSTDPHCPEIFRYALWYTYGD